MNSKLPLLCGLICFSITNGLVQGAALQTNQAADVVLGQPNFDSKQAIKGQLNFVFAPTGVAYSAASGKVFISDTVNNRVLRFSSAAAAKSGGSPEAVFGQANFSDSSANQNSTASESTLSGPAQITVDAKDRLWVADQTNCRVLGYFNASTVAVSNPAADIVLGQSKFTTATFGTTSATMIYPTGVSVGPDDTLWVADQGNHRVLRFANVSSKKSGDSADGVLGEPGFTTSTSTASDTGMEFPSGLYADGAGRLWVADSGNSRVLRFDNAVTKADQDGAAADGVLGQADFQTKTAGVDATHVGDSSSIYLDAEDTLWVSDFVSSRILGFPFAPTLQNNAPAAIVIGQADFTTGTSDVGSKKLKGPAQVGPGPNGSLFVADNGNHRVLRFSPSTLPSITAPSVSISGKKKVTTSKAKFTLKGKATGSVTKVLVKAGRKTVLAQGTTNWAAKLKLQPGKNKIVVTASGPGGISAPARVIITRN